MGCHPSQFIFFKMVETTNQGNYEYCKENIIVVSEGVCFFFTLRWLFLWHVMCNWISGLRTI